MPHSTTISARAGRTLMPPMSGLLASRAFRYKFHISGKCRAVSIYMPHVSTTLAWKKRTAIHSMIELLTEGAGSSLHAVSRFPCGGAWSLARDELLGNWICRSRRLGRRGACSLAWDELPGDWMPRDRKSWCAYNFARVRLLGDWIRSSRVLDSGGRDRGIVLYSNVYAIYTRDLAWIYMSSGSGPYGWTIWRDPMN